VRPAPIQTIMVGDIAVTYLPDGMSRLVPTAVFPASDPQAWARHEQWLDGAGRYLTTLGAFLIRTGDRRVLVDLGLGLVEFDEPDLATVTSGWFLDNLRQVGLGPEDIDTVVYTHLHSDHCGWTAGADGLRFANAEHLVGDVAEWEFWWAHPDIAFAPSVEGVLEPLRGRVGFVGDGQAVAPGVTLRATPGHTPGHQSVVVSSGSQRAVILGDIVHCPVQLAEPEWSLLFDVDAAMARRTRDALLDELEGTDVAVGCGHFPEATFGRVVRGQGRRYWQVG